MNLKFLFLRVLYRFFASSTLCVCVVVVFNRQVRTLVCVRESSDFGARLDWKDYFPRLHPETRQVTALRLQGQGFGDEGFGFNSVEWLGGGDSSDGGGGGGGSGGGGGGGGAATAAAYLVDTQRLVDVGVDPFTGRYESNTTLVLLQEARAHRMSHFQLLKLNLKPRLPPP
jgi:hypothetical protein